MTEENANKNQIVKWKVGSRTQMQRFCFFNNKVKQMNNKNHPEGEKQEDWSTVKRETLTRH